MSSALHEQVRAFILENYLFTRDPAAIGWDDSLTARGIADSTRMLELVLFVEETLGVPVQDEEIVPENFDSINRIVRFVSARRQAESTDSRLSPSARRECRQSRRARRFGITEL